MIIINGSDSNSNKVDVPALLAEIQEAFGKECLPINLPPDNSNKVVDCFFNLAGEPDFVCAFPHDALIDQVIEIDPELMENSGGLLSVGMGGSRTNTLSSSAMPAPVAAEVKQVGTRWASRSACSNGACNCRRGRLALLQIQLRVGCRASPCPGGCGTAPVADIGIEDHLEDVGQHMGRAGRYLRGGQGDELGFDAVLHDAIEDGDIHLTPLEFHLWPGD